MPKTDQEITTTVGNVTSQLLSEEEDFLTIIVRPKSLGSHSLSFASSIPYKHHIRFLEDVLKELKNRELAGSEGTLQ